MIIRNVFTRVIPTSIGNDLKYAFILRISLHGYQFIQVLITKKLLLHFF